MRSRSCIQMQAPAPSVLAPLHTALASPWPPCTKRPHDPGPHKSCVHIPVQGTNRIVGLVGIGVGQFPVVADARALGGRDARGGLARAAALQVALVRVLQRLLGLALVSPACRATPRLALTLTYPSLRMRQATDHRVRAGAGPVGAATARAPERGRRQRLCLHAGGTARRVQQAHRAARDGAPRRRTCVHHRSPRPRPRPRPRRRRCRCRARPRRRRARARRPAPRRRARRSAPPARREPRPRPRPCPRLRHDAASRHRDARVGGLRRGLQGSGTAGAPSSGPAAQVLCVLQASNVSAARSECGTPANFTGCPSRSSDRCPPPPRRTACLSPAQHPSHCGSSAACAAYSHAWQRRQAVRPLSA